MSSTLTEETISAGDAPSARTSTLRLSERYEDLRLLGSGGFGQVRRVWDRKLKRAVAMKILHANVDASASMRARFLAEIELMAQLSHPGIVAIHDFGELEDGRLWFTMAEVQGRTLRSVIDDAFRDGRDPVARRRLLDVFARACETVAHAHSRGVIHRDLKPDNLMIGAFAEVLVMDWGIARRIADLSADVPEPEIAPSPDEETRAGIVVGTPAYMAPEQARADIALHNPATDVYSLGAILHQILVGTAPPPAWARISSDEPLLLADALDVPPELLVICRRAMALELNARYPNASELARNIESFLAGERRRERALEALDVANTLRADLASKRERAAQARADAQRMLGAVRPFDPVEAKLSGWNREDEAELLERDASLRETEWIQAVQGALAIDPDLPEAHAVLADHYRDKLLEAEHARRLANAASFEVLLRAHDRGLHTAFLRGDGAVTLVTNPPRARVVAHRYELSQRRLIEGPGIDLGVTPLHAVTLPHGSYLLRIRAPDHAEVRYPIRIGRNEHWNGIPPGATEPFPIFLPRQEEFGPDEVYVPAGYAWIGGDLDAPDGLPRRFVWIDGFFAGKHPITNEEYLAFLNDLVATGRETEALRACPKTNPGTHSGPSPTLSYARGPDGFFRLKEDDPGETWTPRGPAVLMDWHAAVAYTSWLSARTRKSYRLLHELEREKATRGVDGRFYPWGNHFDPTFACMLSSHATDPRRVDVGTYALDEGPYGMRDGVGNSRDFCGNVWTLEGPSMDLGRLVLDFAADKDPAYRSVRGGAWSSVENHCRAAARFVLRPDQRRSTIGLRVGRTGP